MQITLTLTPEQSEQVGNQVLEEKVSPGVARAQMEEGRAIQSTLTKQRSESVRSKGSLLSSRKSQSGKKTSARYRHCGARAKACGSRS